MSRADDDAIIAEAARRLADARCDADAETTLDAWRTIDPRHDARLAEMEAIWRDLGEASLPALPAPPRTSRRAPPRAPLRRAAWGASAAAAAVVAGVATDLPLRLQADLRTDVGERRVERLADGSLLRLDTDSAVAIDYAPGERRLRLLRGRAEFDVAADPARPFTVDAGAGATTALGTRFVVERTSDGAEVTVTEHAVRLALASGTRARIAEGEAAHYTKDAIDPVHRADASAATAWTRGWLVFEDQPLESVVAELARYHPGMVRLLGDDLANRRVSGAIAIDDPDQAVATLQALLHLRVTRLGSLMVFLHQ